MPTLVDAVRRRARKLPSKTPLVWIALCALIIEGTSPAWGVTFVVDSLDDYADIALNGVCAARSGCTFRAAIAEANRTPESDTIIFAISSPPPRVIKVGSTTDNPLPEVLHPIVVDGAGGIVIEGPGNDPFREWDGIQFRSDSVIRNLTIRSFKGMNLLLDGDRSRVENCTLAGLGGAYDFGVVVRGDDNIIGDGNVIQGHYAGVNIFSGSRNAVRGNRIGTNALGTASDGKTRNQVGIHVGQTLLLESGFPPAVDTVLGNGNLISGNAYRGIWIGGAIASTNVFAVTVQGNLIGTDVTGGHAIPNETGIALENGNDKYVLIGGQPGGLTPVSLCTGACNVISGNSTEMSVFGDANVVGNFIGLNADGSDVVGGGTDTYGIELIGGTKAITRNVITGHFVDVRMLDDAVVLMGCNRIGTDGTGTRIPDPSCSDGALGIWAEQASYVVVGPENQIAKCAEAEAVLLEDVEFASVYENRICTNSAGTEGFGTKIGLHIMPGVEEVQVHDNLISGCQVGLHLLGDERQVLLNHFGTQSDFSSPLPNLTASVIVEGNRNQLLDDTVAYGAADGVVIMEGSGNVIAPLSMFGNAEPGILLDGTSRDDLLDNDSGPNLGQNPPLLTAVALTPDSGSINGELRSKPQREYEIVVYGSAHCHPSGIGEGEHRVPGSTPVSVGFTGTTTFAIPIPQGWPFPDTAWAALAIDEDGNTSEFSNCIQTGSGCAGDCDGDGTVDVAEIITALNRALGLSSAGCAAADQNGDGSVTVDEIVAAVNAALNGC